MVVIVVGGRRAAIQLASKARTEQAVIVLPVRGTPAVRDTMHTVDIVVITLTIVTAIVVGITIAFQVIAITGTTAMDDITTATTCHPITG